MSLNVYICTYIGMLDIIISKINQNFRFKRKIKSLILHNYDSIFQDFKLLMRNFMFLIFKEYNAC